MTMSFICYAKYRAGIKIEAFWNNDGMISIYKSKETDRGGSYICIKPSELKTVVESYNKGGVLLDIQRHRPSMIPWEEKIKVEVSEGGLIVFNCSAKSVINFDSNLNFVSGEPEWHEQKPFYLAYHDAVNILKDCIEFKNEYEKTIGTIPVVGSNCRESEKNVGFPDESACSLDQMASNSMGFPQDDEFSMQQGCPNDSANLDIWYRSPFVQAEKHEYDKGLTELVCYAIEYCPIIRGTMTGMVYVADNPIQTFCVSSNGLFTFTPLRETSVFVESGTLNLETAELKLCFNKAPGKNSIVVNYEYNLEF